MRQYIYNYIRYAHELISRFMALSGQLFELDNAKISDKEKVLKLKSILDNFERKTEHLHKDMITYNLMDSKLTSEKKEHEFHYMNMNFKYIIN